MIKVSNEMLHQTVEYVKMDGKNVEQLFVILFGFITFVAKISHDCSLCIENYSNFVVEVLRFYENKFVVITLKKRTTLGIRMFSSSLKRNLLMLSFNCSSSNLQEMKR